MTSDDHLPRQSLGLEPGRDGRLSTFAIRTLQHVVAICPECARYWDQLGNRLQALVLESLKEVEDVPAPSRAPTAYLATGEPEAIAAQAALVHRERRRHRRAQEEVWELLRANSHDRARMIRGAYRRFRSRQFAHLLLEECRKTVRNAPLQAKELTELIPVSLAWTHGLSDATWAPALLALAAAYRANALRIVGDLPAAEDAFHALRHTLAQRPVGDPATLGEVLSLEASLRIDQQNLAEAGILLERAVVAWRCTDDHRGLARVHIQQANLAQHLGEAEEVLVLFEQASAELAAGGDPTDPYLVLCTITGRVNSLCDLERYAEARQLLDDHLDAYESQEDPHAAATFRCLEGRILLGLGDYQSAADSLAAAQDGMHLLGRDYDGALIALYRAEACHAAGRTRELRVLASELVVQFRDRDVELPALNALKLLARSIASDALTAALFEEVRRQFASSAPKAVAD